MIHVHYFFYAWLSYRGTYTDDRTVSSVRFNVLYRNRKDTHLETAVGNSANFDLDGIVTVRMEIYLIYETLRI